MEGIYRISGSHDEMERLRLSLHTGGVATVKFQLEDIHTLAGLLKLYLRLLPQPLITFSVFRNLQATTRQVRKNIL